HDGKDDLAVGSPSELRVVGIVNGVTTSANAGAVRVYFGSSSGLSASPQLIDQNFLPVTDAGRNELGDRFGASLVAGDLNGDLVDDLAIGSPGEDIIGFGNAGMVQILTGRSGSNFNFSTALARDGRNLPSPFTGLQTGAGFGEALSMGDFNGDAFRIRDLAVGIPSEDVNGVADVGVFGIFGGGLTGTGPVA